MHLTLGQQKEIATSGYLVASYLKSIGFDKNVYLIGSPGFANELADHGIKTTKPGVSYSVIKCAPKCY